MAEQTFTVRGGRNGSQVSVTWTDGELSGDPPTVDLVQVEAELAVLHPDDAHSWSRANSYGELPEYPLQNPDTAWQLIHSVLDTVTTVDGDAPAGAVGASRSARRAP